MDSLEKYWKELIALIIGGGLFTFLGTLLNQLFNKNKTKSEEDKNNSEAVKNKADTQRIQADAELTRAKLLLELQQGLLDVQNALEDMRVKNEEMYQARELERTAKRAELDRIQNDLQLVKESLATENAKNFSLTEDQKKMKQEAFEKDIAAQQEIKSLRDELASHKVKVDEAIVDIQKQTGNLEEKMPKHE